MSFAINPSLTYIDVPLESIQEIYRSTNTIQLQDARFRGHLCEAYICICSSEKRIRAYIAMLEAEMKTVFVYTSELVGTSPSDYSLVLEEAHGFLNSLGYTMERVNLDFSQAMREVIIKGIRVMRPPQRKPHSRSSYQQKPLKQTASAVPPSSKPEAGAAPKAATATEISSLQAELASTRVALEKITREKMAMETAAAREIANLKSAAIRATDSLREAEERFETEISALKAKNLLLSEPRGDKEKELSGESAEDTNAASSALMNEIEELKTQLSLCREKEQSLEEQSVRDASAADREISTLKAELQLLTTNIAAEQAANARALEQIATLNHFENSWKESQQREETLRSSINTLKIHIDTIQTELAEKDSALLLAKSQNDQLTAERQDAEQLKDKVSELEAKLEAFEVETAIQAVEQREIADVKAQFESLIVAKQEVEAEYIRLANESREREDELLEALYAAEDEIRQLSEEADVSARVAAAELEALRAELKRMIVGGISAPEKPDKPSSKVYTSAMVSAPANEPKKPATAAHPTEEFSEILETENIIEPEPETAADEPARETEPARISEVSHAPVERSRAPEPLESSPMPQAAPTPEPAQIPAEIEEEQFDDDLDAPLEVDPVAASGLVNEFGGFSVNSSGKSYEFIIDGSLPAIEYHQPSEIAALVYSCNSVQAMPDGKKSERCKAFAVALKLAGKYEVYIAWYMMDSGKSVICKPDHQPDSKEACTLALLDAVAYFEIVGFMMEVEDLGRTVGNRIKVLKKVPALKRLKS